MVSTVARIKQILTDPVKFKAFVTQNKKELIMWGSFVFIIILVYFCFSDGDFSFFFTVSGAVQMFGFFLILLRVKVSESCSGISLQTLICYVIVFFFRLCSILLYDGYLPYDSSGDLIYRLGEILSFGLSLGVTYLVGFKYKRSMSWDLDQIKCYYLIVPALILAILFHPCLNNNYFTDICWTFALYLEAVAMFPQIYLFSKKGGEIESYTSHYVASQGISRILSFVFWLFTFHELNDEKAQSLSISPGYVGYCIFVAQIIQILLMGDFLYQYTVSLNSGLPMTLPYVV